jgi:hypothetical protein
MRDTELLQMALGVLPPWIVASSEFDAAAKRLDIHLDFPKGSRFSCPDCGAADCPAVFDASRRDKFLGISSPSSLSQHSSHDKFRAALSK